MDGSCRLWLASMGCGNINIVVCQDVVYSRRESTCEFYDCSRDSSLLVSSSLRQTMSMESGKQGQEDGL